MKQEDRTSFLFQIPELEEIPVFSITIKERQNVFRRKTAVHFSFPYNNKGNFVVLDTETTGLGYDARVVELSAIRFERFTPVLRFETLIDPEIKIPYGAYRIHHISDEMVYGKPKIDQVTDSFLEFVGNNDIVGHNLSYDLGRLEYGGIVFSGERKYYDTLSLARKILKKEEIKKNSDFEAWAYEKKSVGVKDHKLETLCAYYGIKRKRAHRGSDDCLATGVLFHELIATVEEKRIDFR